MNENNKFDVVGTNIAEKATMIWNVADMLRGPFNIVVQLSRQKSKLFIMN